jgi:hypothetical protein
MSAGHSDFPLFAMALTSWGIYSAIVGEDATLRQLFLKNWQILVESVQFAHIASIPSILIPHQMVEARRRKRMMLLWFGCQSCLADCKPSAVLLGDGVPMPVK